MFRHNFKYTLKVLLQNKTLVFWTLAFPFIVGTFFYMAFSNIAKNEEFKRLDVAVVNSDAFNNNLFFKYAFASLSDDDNKDSVFKTSYVTNEEAKKMLDENKVVGYLDFESNEPKLFFKQNGINQTIFKYVIEEIVQASNIVQNIGINDINAISENKVKLNDITSSNMDYMMIEFYTLIAMTCLYGSMIGMYVINKNMANMGNIGMRISVTPTKKIITILSSLLASFIIQIVGLIMLFLYTIFLLKIDYGNNIFLIILLSIIGSLAGLSLGVFTGTTFKTNENAKIGILIAIVMVGCFFAGMMGVMMKYVIDSKMPIINMLNPANMITDGFYALYYYASTSRYWFNIISLIIFIIIMTIFSFITLRRQTYDSL